MHSYIMWCVKLPLPCAKLAKGHAVTLVITGLDAVVTGIRYPDTAERIYIDTAPAFNFYTMSALIAADRVLIPFDCDSFSRQALYGLLTELEDVREEHNEDLAVEGIVVNQRVRSYDVPSAVAGPVSLGLTLAGHPLAPELSELQLDIKITGGPERWAAIGGAMENFGIGFGHTFFGLMAALTESVVALMFAAGFLFRPSCLLLASVMLVAAAQHIISGQGSPAHAIKNLSLFLGFTLIGPGKYSVDAMMRKKS